MGTLQRSLVIETCEGQVAIFDEPTYSFGSADNLRTYDTEIRLDSENLYSVHGVRTDGKWSAIFGAGGGPSTVHQHSAIEVDGRLYLAVGDQVICLNLVTGLKEWSRRVDLATCFGVHWDCLHEALISHGELQISRLSLTGDEIWSATGADIFSGGFKCLGDGIEVIDFSRSVYLFDYRAGTLLTLAQQRAR
jgi:outer membrane protein assembly factor BamB